MISELLLELTIDVRRSTIARALLLCVCVCVCVTLYVIKVDHVHTVCGRVMKFYTERLGLQRIKPFRNFPENCVHAQ
jgi:hypothetical protein